MLKSTIIKPIESAGKTWVESLSLRDDNRIIYSTDYKVYQYDVRTNLVENLVEERFTYFSKTQPANEKIWLGDNLGRLHAYNYQTNSLKTVLSDTSGSAILFMNIDENNHTWVAGIPDVVVEINSENDSMTFHPLKNSSAIRVTKIPFTWVQVTLKIYCSFLISRIGNLNQ